LKKIIAFLLIFLTVLIGAVVWLISGGHPTWVEDARLPISCALAGGFGGVVYTLRAVYLNACVHKRWDSDWEPWYYIRPFVSLVCGGVSWVFLKAGLLILEADTTAGASELGFYALAFIAGLNVDKFISKIEDVAQAAWGIEKSRAGREGGESKQ
jgi:hypothetical protein